MKKIRLTESQARRAIRKWLFEYATDSGVSHRASTDDKKAGKMGDDREDQPASMIQPELPIMAMDQMAVQLTKERPSIEDPEFVPGTVEELGRSVDAFSQLVPHSEIEWFYEEIQSLVDQAVENGNQVDTMEDTEEEDLEKQINPAQPMGDAANESLSRWLKILSNNGALKEARRKSARQRDFARKWKQGDRLDLHREDENDEWMDDDYEEAVSTGGSGLGDSMSGEVVDGEYVPSFAEMEDMAHEMDMPIEDLPGYNPRKHKRTKKELVQSSDGEEAKLRELVALGIYPGITTMSGLRKKIEKGIDPVVEMMTTAGPAFEWLSGFYNDQYQLDWKGRKIAGPDIYEMAIKAYEKTYKKDQAKMQALYDALESGKFYGEAMAEIVMVPLIKKWNQEKKAGNIDVSSRKSQNNLMMSDWILEVVLNKGFGKSKAPRRAKKLVTAMQGMKEFKEAIASVEAESTEG